MHLTNFSKVRIKKHHETGFSVQMQFKTWYGKKYWKHIISVSGMPDEPWYFNSYEMALNEAKKYFGWDLILGTEPTSFK